MNDYVIHKIEDDLSEDWVEEWAVLGVAEIETYLAKHAAFLTYLGEDDAL
jgi:hypothetical protein